MNGPREQKGARRSVRAANTSYDECLAKPEKVWATACHEAGHGIVDPYAGSGGFRLGLFASHSPYLTHRLLRDELDFKCHSRLLEESSAGRPLLELPHIPLTRPQIAYTDRSVRATRHVGGRRGPVRIVGSGG